MYLIISIIVLLLSFFLFRKAGGVLSLKQPNMIAWIFFFQLVFQTFISSVLVVYRLDNHYAINSIFFEESRIYGWLAIQYTMLAMPLGMMFVSFVRGQRNVQVLFKKYCSKPLVTSLTYKDKSLKRYFFLLSLFSIAAVIYTFYVIREIPILNILRLDALSIAQQSIEFGREFQGNQYIRNIFGLLLTPILSFIAYGYYKITKNNKDKLWFFIMCLFSILILTYNFSKAPIVQYVISFFFISVLLGKKFSKKKLFVSFAVVMSILLTFYILFSEDYQINELLLSYNSGIWGRILLSQSGGTYFSFDYFPTIHEHIGFKSFSALFIDNHSQRSARIIMEIFNPEGVKLGVVGVMNSLFIGEAWANFGIVGVIIAPFIVGAVIQLIFLVLISGDKTPLKVALYAYFTLNIPITGGFNDFIYSPTWIILGVILGTGYFLSKYRLI